MNAKSARRPSGAKSMTEILSKKASSSVKLGAELFCLLLILAALAVG